ncbi:MAG: hypothetical protein V6Z86_06130 [Hyphomicrobiales bacterium]
MLKLVNGILIAAMLVMAFWLYGLERRSREVERKIAVLSGEIDEQREMIALLDAEWAALTSPRRIEALAVKYLHLESLKPTQIITQSDITDRIPEGDGPSAPDGDGSPSGGISEEIQ